MSHDIHASWATAEIAGIFAANPNNFVQNTGQQVTAYAGRESNTVWPFADGVINIEIDTRLEYSIALEFKRENEGLHGVLTALGQAHAYLNKGYHGSIIVIPRQYQSHNSPGTHLAEIIALTGNNLPIGVFVYDVPDTTQTSPFRGRITAIRPLDLNNNRLTHNGAVTPRQGTETQWAHLREGSSDPSAFCEYLRIANELDAIYPIEPNIDFLPQQLVAAVNRIAPRAIPINYLASAPRNSFMDYTWKHFWYRHIFNERTAPIWDVMVNGVYTLNAASSNIKLPDDSGYKVFFARSDGGKPELIDKLNSALISEDEAWEIYAKKVHERAHSYREDIDSGLEHIGLIDDTGKPSELGYKFLIACERNNWNPNNGTPKMLLGASILKNGDLVSLLHYIYRLTRERLSINPMEFTSGVIQNDLLEYLNSIPNSLTPRVLNRTQKKYKNADNYCSHKFNIDEYLRWLANELSVNLHVMSTSTARGGAVRPPLQGEISVLRQYKIVGKYRVGIGLDINWPMVQSFLEIDI